MIDKIKVAGADLKLLRFYKKKVGFFKINIPEHWF